MGHHTVRQGYQNFADRINLLPQGATVSQSLFNLLEVLVSEKEAAILSKLPVRPFDISKGAKALGISEVEAEKVLIDLASRAMLLDVVNENGLRMFTLPPPIAGFFEFSLMRLGGSDKDQRISELLYQYMNVEEDFIKELFTGTKTKIGRVFVNEEALRQVESKSEITILDYERASSMVTQSKTIAVGTCYCRHKMEHLGKNCDAPIEDICITLGHVAESLSKHGYARQINGKEAMKVLDRAYEHHLVQMGENVQKDLPFLCNCCGCCCEALQAIKKHGTLTCVNTTNFLPEVNEKCIGCGKCAKLCPIDCITMEDVKLGEETVVKRPVIDKEACLGCGVCVRGCLPCGLTLKQRGQRQITPVNSAHRIILMAIEKGKLQNLIFDNQAFASHRVMAAILGGILKLEPVKRLLVAEQLQSFYIRNLIGK